MAIAVNSRRCFVVACVCLLVVAAGLRFYGLTEHTLRYDEAKVALNSVGAFGDVLDNTRHENSSPILYPMALWAVQKVASTELSVRFLPAAASALTVGALLFLMPRVGVSGWAAFLAALLAALSAVAIAHAHNAREYSVDALCGALMIAGLLRYLRDGGKGLLCAALFVGPLLQYGLILFGVAALGAAALLPAVSSHASIVGGRRSYGAALWGRLRRRVDLLLPIACFGGACALSWTLTASYQWTASGWGGDAYLADYYYRGGFEAWAIAEFAVKRTWDLLSYHMPNAIAWVALFGFAALLSLALLLRRGVNAIALLAMFAVGIALCAALVGAYPLGDVRQCLYLGPIIFLAVGVGVHSLAVDAGALARRERLAGVLVCAAGGVIAIVCAADIWQYYSVYRSGNGIEQIFAALEEREREGDAVYVSRWEVPLVAFYKREKPDNYFYSRIVCWESGERECVSEVFDEIFRAFGGSRRIWFIHSANVSMSDEMAAYSQEAAVEEVAANEWTTLHLISARPELAADIRADAAGMPANVELPVAPRAASIYNLYVQGEALYYAKQPCATADTEAWFFLHVYPENAADLPASRRRHGFHNLDFKIFDYELLAGDRCLIRRDLPEYPIKRIHTGQYISQDGPVTWETDFPFNP